MRDTLLGTYKLPRDCNADEVGSCQYVLRWFHEVHDQILMVIFVKNVKKTSIGVSVFNNSNFGESDVYKVDKDLELKEFRIDINGNKSKKLDKTLKKLEIKILPASDGELDKNLLKLIVN